MLVVKCRMQQQEGDEVQIVPDKNHRLGALATSSSFAG